MGRIRMRLAALTIALIAWACFGVSADSETRPSAASLQVPAHPPEGECARSLDQLIALLKSSDAGNRWIAADCLGETKDSRAVEPLVHAVYVEDYPRIAMIERKALKTINDPHTADLLLEGLNSKETRWKAAISLGALQISRGLDPLIMFLKSDDSEDRRTAAMSLGLMKDPRAIGPLISAFAERDEVLRRRVAISLGEIGDARAVDALVKALDDPDVGVEWNAIASLGEIKDSRAVLPLTKILNGLDEEEHTRTEAADALAKIGDTLAVDPLIQAATSGSNAVKWHAARALISMDQPQAKQFLTVSFDQRKIAVVAGAYPFFIRRGDPGAELRLVEALNEFGDYVMALDFLYCGNSILAEAAHQWYSKNGYTEPEQTEGKSLIWGSKK